MPKRVGTAHFFEKSYKNTRTRKRPPVRAAFFWCERWDSKGRPERSEGKKHAGGMFFRPWESPFSKKKSKQWGGKRNDSEKAVTNSGGVLSRSAGL